MTRSWTTPEDIRARVRRRWDDGTLLRALAADEPFPVVEVPLRGPKPAEIGSDLGAVQTWVASLRSGASRRGKVCYELQDVAIGGRHIGRNRLPGRARVTCFEQAWQLLGVSEEVTSYELILQQTATEPAVRSWTAANPMRALALGQAPARVRVRVAGGVPRVGPLPA
jgi:hypothetical protein